MMFHFTCPGFCYAICFLLPYCLHDCNRRKVLTLKLKFGSRCLFSKQMQNTFLKFLLSSFLGIACLSGARGDVLSVVFTGRYSLSGASGKLFFRWTNMYSSRVRRSLHRTFCLVWRLSGRGRRLHGSAKSDRTRIAMQRCGFCRKVPGSPPVGRMPFVAVVGSGRYGGARRSSLSFRSAGSVREGRSRRRVRAPRFRRGRASRPACRSSGPRSAGSAPRCGPCRRRS